MPNTGTGAGHLEITPAEGLDVAETVTVDELAVDNVREDLELAVRVGGESLGGLYKLVLLTFGTGCYLLLRGPH